MQVNHANSFSKAAIKLGVAPSVVSKKITQLENNLSLSLFHRTTRSVSLTEEGRKVLAVAERVLAEVKALEISSRTTRSPEELSGVLRISTISTYVNSRLVTIIKKFCQLHPHIRFEFVLTNSFINLADENIDVAVRICKSRKITGQFFKLEENKLIFCASPEFLNLHGEITTLEALTEFKLIYLQSHGAEKFKFSKKSIKNHFEKSAVQANSGDVLNHFAMHGLGVALRTKWDIDKYLAEGKLIEIKVDDYLESTSSVYALYQDIAYLPKRTKIFLKFLKQEYDQLNRQ